MTDYYKSMNWPGKDQICPRNFLQMSDSDIIVSLHLVIPFISMVLTSFVERYSALFSVFGFLSCQCC
jgi:hypothetical protein